MVTDYDCWKMDEPPVNVEEVVARLHDNAKNAEAILARALPLLPATRSCPCGAALQQAILTDRARIPAEALRRLRPVAGARLE
jgi:5'-methylthioadenosine phosphorylase